MSATGTRATGTRPRRQRLGLRAAPVALWFAVLGGAVAWTLHTLIGWGVVETVCRANHDTVNGIPLRLFVGVVTVLMLVVALLSTAAALRLHHRLAALDPDDPVEALRTERARFMTVIGIGANVLFVLIIALGGLAGLVFSPCVR